MFKPDNSVRRKEREAKEDVEDGLKFVIDGAKIKCDLCTIPEGDLKVNYDTPSIQDKRVATVVEKDKRSLIFKGNCKKSFNSSVPCAALMKLGEWKNPGTVYFQDELVLLLRSTIKCEYGGVDIKITDSGQRNVMEKVDATGAPVPAFLYNYDIKFELDETRKTVVPFGILDFDKKNENQFFSFKYELLSKSEIDFLCFKIMDEDDTVIYETTYLKEVIVKAPERANIFFAAKKPTEVSVIPKIRNYKQIYGMGRPDDYTKEGKYYIYWDGFDNQGVYDSTRFNDKKLKAKITAIKGGTQKSIVVDFSTKYNQVDWVDVKIDKNTNRIDVALRVDLTDGGAEGLECNTYSIEKEESYETLTPTNLQNPFAGMEIRKCDWDKISNESLGHYKKPPITSRTKTYEDLEKLTLEGINQFWSRNFKNIGNGVRIFWDNYEVHVDAVSDKKGLPAPAIIYQTNTEKGRSSNFELSRRLFFHEGYRYSDYWKNFPTTDLLYRNKGWEYMDADIEDYKRVSAHEIGHEILLAFGGKIFSWQHKGSSYLNQKVKSIKGSKKTWPWGKPLDFMPEISGEYYPETGEVDLMKYYHRYYDRVGNLLTVNDLSRTIAAENDVLGLIWLTKIEIK